MRKFLPDELECWRDLGPTVRDVIAHEIPGNGNIYVFEGIDGEGIWYCENLLTKLYDGPHDGRIDYFPNEETNYFESAFGIYEGMPWSLGGYGCSAQAALPCFFCLEMDRAKWIELFPELIATEYPEEV